MKVLDLFSGIGGFSLGLERAGMQTVAFCEIDPFCRRVLAEHWPEVPIYDDVRTIRNEFAGPVDVICGGFPCQPFSLAGKRRGAADDRHLWPEMLACIKHYRPAWVIGENVPGLSTMGQQCGPLKMESKTITRDPSYDFYEAIYTREEKMLLNGIYEDLKKIGYKIQSFFIPAGALGAAHLRDRLWIVAHAGNNGEGWRGICEPGTCFEAGGSGASVTAGGSGELPCTLADSAGNGWGQGRAWGTAAYGEMRAGAGAVASDTDNPGRGEQRRAFAVQPEQPAPECDSGRETQPGLGGSPDGVSAWLDGSWEEDIPRTVTEAPDRTKRLCALGNAVVPQIPELIGRMVMSIENAHHV